MTYILGYNLDFDFVYDRKSKQYSVITEGEFIAVSRFISSELDRDISQLKNFLAWLDSTQYGSKTLTEWTVDVEGDDVDVALNQTLEFREGDQHFEQQDTTLDWECQCSCGKQDLIKLLRAYIRFKQ